MRSLFVGISSALGISPQLEQGQQQHQRQEPAAVRGVTTTSNSVTTVMPASCAKNPLRVDAKSGFTGFTSPSDSYDTCSFATEKSPDLPFSMLLLTQNIGGLGSRCSIKSGKDEKDCVGGIEATRAPGVPNAVCQRVREFLTELRLFIYEASRREFVSHHRRDETNTEGCLFAPESASCAVEAAPPLLDVIVVHFQEVGGTRLDTEFNVFFAEALCTLLPEAAWCSGLLMESNNEAGRFTALGSVIFLSHRMYSISSILSFRHRTFVSIADDPATYGSSPTFLFHGGKFSGAETSRKGYLLTSLRFGTVVVNFLNVHLPHDIQNTDAVGKSPSPYALRRQEALLEAMAECMVFVSPQDPLFIFGDFNTRLEAHSLLQYLKETLQIEVELAVKGVRAPDNFWELFTELQHLQTLKKFDVEMQRMMDLVAQQSGVELAEFAIRFPPTYSRPAVWDSVQIPRAVRDITLGEEGSDKKERECSDDGKKEELREGAEKRKAILREGTSGDEESASSVLTRIMEVPARGYIRQRIPAWCDRVIWNPAGLELMTGRRSSFLTSSLSSTFVGRDLGEDAFCRYTYRSFAFNHTDHDCVALLF